MRAAPERQRASRRFRSPFSRRVPFGEHHDDVAVATEADGGVDGLLVALAPADAETRRTRR